MSVYACAALSSLLGACDSCEEIPCDFEGYLEDLAGAGAMRCEDPDCAIDALEEGRSMIYRYAEHPNFSFAYVYVGDSAPAAADARVGMRYYDVSFGKVGGNIVRRECEALVIAESSPDGLACEGGAMLNGRADYPEVICSKKHCTIPAG